MRRVSGSAFTASVRARRPSCENESPKKRNGFLVALVGGEGDGECFRSGGELDADADDADFDSDSKTASTDDLTTDIIAW